MTDTKELEVSKISSLLLKFSLPAIVGLLVNALYNIIDSAFVGRGVGDMALAGVTISFPIMTVFMACVMLVGMGATSLISIRLGERKVSEAEEIIGNALVAFLIIGFSLTLFGLLFIEPILNLFGANKDVFPYASKYMRIIMMGSIFLALGTGMNNFIRAEGFPKIAMYTMLIGAITNIVLDYVFIFIFKWGIQGAAFATTISYAVNTTWVLYHFISGKSKLKIRRKNLKIKKHIVKNILIVGFPTFVLQITSSIQQLILNRKLAFYGGSLALAAVGIIINISTLLIMPAIGISQGAQPIIGFNFGAKKYDRVKDTLKLTILYSTVIATLGFLVSRLWPEQIIKIFNKNPELISLSCHAMAIFFKFLPLVGVQIISSSYFQAVGKPNQATLLSLSRQIIIFIPLLIIMPRFYGLEGVWWSVPFSDLGAFIMTGLWLWFEIKELNRINDSQKELLEDSSV